MLFSVIIPTCNRNDLLEKCLKNLHPDFQNIDFAKFEVIVTDDNNNKKTEQFINENFSWVKWVEGPRKGPAANRNNGARCAKGEWLIFTDDDCIPQASWINGYNNFIKTNNNVSVLEGKTIADREKRRFDEVSPINLTGKKLWSCNFAIKKDLFDSLGGFDEKFPYSLLEDVDLQKRILIQNYVYFVPEALVIHPWRQNRAFKNFQKRLLCHRYFAKKHDIINIKYRLERFKMFVTSIFTNFKNLLFYSLKGWKYYFDKLVMNFCLIFI